MQRVESSSIPAISLQESAPRAALATLEDPSSTYSHLFASATSPLTAPASATPISNFRRVYSSQTLKNEFAKFLKTIFFTLDAGKVEVLMAQLLADPSKSDEEIYNALAASMTLLKKPLAPLRQIHALNVLKKGMGAQCQQLMHPFESGKFHDYMEIYDRRYIRTLRKMAGLPLDGQTISYSNSASLSLSQRIEIGFPFSNAFKKHVCLNDESCKDPELEPELTHHPLGPEVADQSLDFVSAIGGLHHVPESRIDAFAGSIHKKLRPGGVILLRDHDIKSEDQAALVWLVHTFVNAAAGTSWQVDSQEIRNGKSLEEWSQFMKTHGFVKVSTKDLILTDDPTDNAMMAFVRAPENLEELITASHYLKNATRPSHSTFGTGIEWGNVRFSQNYSEFVQDHHAYAFDYVGHIRQHWKFFYEFIKNALTENRSRFIDLLFSGDMAMNFFIALTTTIQCLVAATLALPQRCLARLKHGSQWRNVANLSALERVYAKMEKDYCQFIEHTPFYSYPYLAQIKGMFQAIYNSNESWAVKALSYLDASMTTLSLLLKTAISKPLEKLYTSPMGKEPDRVQMIIHDPHHQFESVMQSWQAHIDEVQHPENNLKVIYETRDDYKLISVPRYKPYQEICKRLNEAGVSIYSSGGQKELAIDVLLKVDVKAPTIEGAKLCYEMAKLQDAQARRYATYKVALTSLGTFKAALTAAQGELEYIHE